MFKQKSKRKTITLVEALVTIVLIALLTILLLTRIGGTLDRPKDLEITRDFKQYTDAAIVLQPANKDLNKDNLNNYVDKTLQFTTDKSYSKNPYGEEYRYTAISNGFKIESDKYKNGKVVSTRVLTITRNPNGQLDITDTTTNSKDPTTKPPVTYPDPPANVLEYYNFSTSPLTEIPLTDDGYRVELTTAFKEALDTNTEYQGWKAGEPLPNPGSMYNSKPVISMEWMFFESQAATLDLSKFDTSNVTDMTCMFANSQTTTLDLSSFDTSNVTRMASMFNGSLATTLDLSNFDTSKVTNMSYMFYDSKATSLNLSSFNTSNVTNMENMFGCSQATSLDLSKFNTSNVTNMTYMFTESQALALDLSSFDTSNVMNMYEMFFGSQAKTGYAKTEYDKDRFNSSLNKPTGLVFVVK